MKKNYDVVALGELLIDFTQHGISEQGNPLFEANPGGAPANVLSMLEKLGRKTAFVGKVGDDGFGNQLDDALKEQNIDTRWLYRDRVVHTTLALVHKLPNGDRDFSFYRKPGADVMLTADEISEEMFAGTRIFHLGSLSLTEEPVKSATVKALELARQHGCIITFDPNLRPPLWDSLETAKKEIAYVMERCDVLKISDNEITWFTGEDDYDAGVSWLFAHYPNIRLLTLSMGPDGSRAYCPGLKVEERAFLSDKTVETTGAGDTFCACLLNFVLEHGLEGLREADLKEMLKFGNAAASLITMKKGALRVMPERRDVENYIRECGR